MWYHRRKRVMKAQRKRLYIRGFSNGPYSRLHWVVRVDFGLFIVRVDVETALSQCFLLGVAFFFKLFDFIYPQVFPVSAVFLSLKMRSEEHTSELQSRCHLVCRLLLE